MPKDRTQVGVLYFIESISQNTIKVGFADNVASRLSTLQTGNSSVLTVGYQMPGTRGAELRLHSMLKSYRIAREWYPRVHLFDSLWDDLDNKRLDHAMYELMRTGSQDLEGALERQFISEADVMELAPIAIGEYDEWVANGCTDEDEEVQLEMAELQMQALLERRLPFPS